MTPQKQLLVCKETGDCMRACIASMLDLPITTVPNFMDKSDDYFNMLWNTLIEHGYSYVGHDDKPPYKYVQASEGIEGYFMAVVNSINYEGEVSEAGRPITHAVVFKGLEFCFDPSPKATKQWSIDDVRYFYIIERSDV